MMMGRGTVGVFMRLHSIIEHTTVIITLLLSQAYVEYADFDLCLLALRKLGEPSVERAVLSVFGVF
jgi:hypothetical protein